MVLLVVAPPQEAALIRETLEPLRIGSDVRFVPTVKAGLDALHEQLWDAIVLAIPMGETAISQRVETYVDIAHGAPVIAVVDAIGEDAAAELMRCGAADVVTFARIARLPAVFDRELHTKSRNMTEQRKMSEMLRASEERLLQAQKMEALGILAGGVAHDFNNILAAILCSADVLLHDLRRLPNAGELPEIVFELQTAAQRGTDLVRQILTFSRHAKKRRVSLDPAEVLHESIDVLKKICPANVDIRLSIQSHPFVLADATQLQQVLMNLGTNSFQALENTKGVVSFELSGVVIDAATAQTEVGLREGSYARIRVKDDGSGMDAHTIEHLFEPFFTTKHDGKGTGLGMSVVRGIVTSHEGSIRVQSTIGQGTTVDLWFPAVPGVVNMDEGKKIGILHGKAEHVLVIDDEVGLARIFGRVLQSIGYRVTVETDSAKAIEIIQKDASSFNVALIDLHMPPPGGIDVAQRLHRLRPDLPIFIMSGFSDTLGETLPPDSGIVGILQKPVTRETLATELRRVLDSVATT